MRACRVSRYSVRFGNTDAILGGAAPPLPTPLRLVDALLLTPLLPPSRSTADSQELLLMLVRLTTMFASRGALHMSAVDGEHHPAEVRRVP